MESIEKKSPHWQNQSQRKGRVASTAQLELLSVTEDYLMETCKILVSVIASNWRNAFYHCFDKLDCGVSLTTYNATSSNIGDPI
jgi:hypothetical protein